MSVAVQGLIERRQGWRKLADQGLRLAERLIKSDGTELLADDEVTFALTQLGKTSFGAPGDYGAEQLSLAFVFTAKATLRAGADRRRAILAVALKGLAEAVDAMLTDDADQAAAASWKRQMGED